MIHSVFCVCGALMKNIFKISATAEIVAVHSESVYIRRENGRLLLICPYKYGRVPFGAAVSDYESFRLIRDFTVGEKVELFYGKLRFSDGVVIELCETSPTEEKFLYSVVPDTEKLRACADFLRGHAASRGIATAADAFLCFGVPGNDANICALRAAAEADVLERAIISDDRSLLEQTVKKYIGLGYGLTPSGDDLMCGMLYTFYRMKEILPSARVYAKALSDAVMQNIDGTNDVSREYLRCACDGVNFEIIDRVIAYLSDGVLLEYEKEREKLLESMKDLLNVGASSGSDILCGILFAMYILSLDSIGQS